MLSLILKFCFWFLLIVALWHFLTYKYLNLYKLVFIVGAKGAGKTTTLYKLAYRYLKAGWNVYSTEEIRGCYKIHYKDIGVFKIPPDSVLLVDEVGMLWDNRKHKEFPDHLRNWFKMQRHERVKVYLFSQVFDVDLKIRQLTDQMYLMTNVLRIFSYGKRIMKHPDLIKPSAEAPARLDDVLEFDSFFWFWCGSRFFTYIPKYAPLFDSYIPLDLPEKDFPYIEHDEISEIFAGVSHKGQSFPRLRRKYRNVRKAFILLRSRFAEKLGSRIQLLRSSCSSLWQQLLERLRPGHHRDDEWI